jgi:hypothetical protein
MNLEGAWDSFVSWMMTTTEQWGVESAATFADGAARAF